MREFINFWIVYTSFREKMAHYPSVKCDGCLENCSGGCPLYWLKFNPDEQIKGSRLLEK